ncbi:GntR family transcriptional regulator [Pantoea rodasii]|nr:GntR family transcriptional regulator [Pantoea rodasii]
MTSLYRQIADTLQQEIAAGHFQPSGKLPSETALEQRFAVSRVTVRLALKYLTEQGIVERKQGKGTYVSGRKVAHGINVMRSFHESLKQQGLNATMRLLSKEQVPAPESLRTMFQLARTLTFISRLHLVDRDPIAVGYSHFPAFSHELNWEETEQQPTWALLEKATKNTITRSDIAIRLDFADKELAEILGTSKNAPLFLLERTSWFESGQCAENSRFFIRPERYEFILSNG